MLDNVMNIVDHDGPSTDTSTFISVSIRDLYRRHYWLIKEVVLTGKEKVTEWLTWGGKEAERLVLSINRNLKTRPDEMDTVRIER